MATIDNKALYFSLFISYRFGVIIDPLNPETNKISYIFRRKKIPQIINIRLFAGKNPIFVRLKIINQLNDIVMSKIKVGINGFGRIGRLAFRAAFKRNDIEIVGINDLLEVNYIAYMLKYDTMHGRFDGTVEVKDGKLVVNGKSIRVTAEKDPANLKWNEVGAEYVLECTGFFLTKETAMGHIKAGAKHVVMSGSFKR